MTRLTPRKSTSSLWKTRPKNKDAVRLGAALSGAAQLGVQDRETKRKGGQGYTPR